MRNTIPYADETQALCADPSVEPEWWFEDSEPGLAQAICAECPLSVRCLEYAVNNNIEFGVWGGQTADERQQSRKYKRKAKK
jgi:WhiB family redox-sensing transcriptional regulator